MARGLKWASRLRTLSSRPRLQHMRMYLALDQLEPKLLLASSVQLNLQFQPHGAAALSSLTHLITTAGATMSPTTVSGLYVIDGPAATAGQLATALSANPAVQYAAPAMTVSTQQAAN